MTPAAIGLDQRYDGDLTAQRGQSLKYRPDIDGLRAVAIIPVLLFHTGVPGFQGGFCGVDVFFVISGFLISDIIWRRCETGSFSFASFYERRIRRVAPVLFAVMASSLMVGYGLLLPADFTALAKSVAATTLFVSNILFWSEANYFDTPALTKPLLHTWSLGIEEQFYVFVPIALVILSKIKTRGALFACLWGAAAVSFVISVWAVGNAPQAGFYLLPARAWELLLGTTLAVKFPVVVRPRWILESLAFLGLCAMLFSIVLYSSATPFPGWAALPPCLGAAMVIFAGRSTSTFVTQLLGTAPLRFVGLISYSLYMWHWPIVVFTRYFLIDPAGPLAVAGMILGSLAMAVLSWRFIERPFRQGATGVSGRVLFGQFAAISAVVVMVAIGAASLPVLQPKMPGAVHSLLNADYYDPGREACHQVYTRHIKLSDLCVRGAQGVAPSFVLVGDSHAGAIADGVFTAAKQANVSGYQLSDSGYRPVSPYIQWGETKKYRYINGIFDRLVREPNVKRVIVVVYWHQALQDDYRAENGRREMPGVAGLDAVFKNLVQSHRDKRFIFVVPPPMSPQFGVGPAARGLLYHRDFVPDRPVAEYDLLESTYLPVLRRLDLEPNVDLIETRPLLCDEHVCHGRIGGKLAFRDDNHLSEASALALVPALRAAFAQRR